MESSTANVTDILELAHGSEWAPATVLVCKLLEEAGELAEAMLIEQGFKQSGRRESVVAEAADVILTTLAVVSRVRRDTPCGDLIAELSREIGRRTERYAQRLARSPWTDEPSERPAGGS